MTDIPDNARRARFYQDGRPTRQRRVVDDDDEDTIPADIDALRRELTRRLEAMAAGASRDVPRGTD